jgi:Na+/pantothenate symporter
VDQSNAESTVLPDHRFSRKILYARIYGFKPYKLNDVICYNILLYHSFVLKLLKYLYKCKGFAHLKVENVRAANRAVVLPGFAARAIHDLVMSPSLRCIGSMVQVKSRCKLLKAGVRCFALV